MYISAIIDSFYYAYVYNTKKHIKLWSYDLENVQHLKNKRNEMLDNMLPLVGGSSTLIIKCDISNIKLCDIPYVLDFKKRRANAIINVIVHKILNEILDLSDS